MSPPSPQIAILAGGAGTRFWPMGRVQRPKQVLALCADDARPLLELTLERTASLSSRPPWLIAPQALKQRLMAAAGRGSKTRFLAEPAARNTAPAVALAAYEAASRDPEQVVLIVPADHYVHPVSRYAHALAAMCARAAKVDAILTLGLAPTRPATGYGWLELGAKRGGSKRESVFEVTRFVEKPSLAKARRYLLKGGMLWNGGTFAFKARVFQEQLRRHLPDVAAPLDAAFARHATPGFAAALRRAYRSLPSISVDHGVMEHADAVEVVRCEVAWDDLGSWDAVGRHRKADAQGNSIRGDATLLDANRCLVDAAVGHVALLGVSDLIVVRTKDTVLVARRGDAEAVRQLVAKLRAEGREDLLQ